MKNLILVLGVVSINLFFSISAIIGYDYGGSSDSKIYIIYSISISVINIIIFFIGFFRKKFNLGKNELLILGIPFSYAILYLFTIFFYGTPSKFIVNYFNYFLLWGIPSICIAIYINKMNLYKRLTKYIDIIVIIFSLGIVNSIIVPFLKGISFDGIGGATYQTASYIAAFAFGLNVYLIFFGYRYKRFKFTRYKVYKVLEFCFLFIQLTSSLISGGRGGVVLIIVYIVCILIFILTDKKKKLYSKFFFIGSVAVIISIIIFPIMMQKEIFIHGFDRAFEFISPSGKINWNGTSGRGVLYENTIEIIKSNLVNGIGIFRIPKNPHNLVLEILLGGGIIYLILAIIVGSLFLKRLFKMIKYDVRNRILIIIFLYPIIMLMFSGTYMNSQEFWFALAFVFSYRLQNKCEIYK